MRRLSACIVNQKKKEKKVRRSKEVTWELKIVAENCVANFTWQQSSKVSAAINMHINQTTAPKAPFILSI